MKHLTKYIFLSLALFYFSCESPAPIQLEADSNSASDEFEFEIPVENSDTFIASDYDSIGIVSESTAKTQIIINGIKWDYKLVKRNISLAKAVFYDDDIIMDSKGRKISRKSKSAQYVYFGNTAATQRDYRVSYYDEGEVRDTSVGPQYVLYDNRPRLGFNFPYNSSINVRIKLNGMSDVTVPVATPTEITGTVEALGKRANGNLVFHFKWNAVNQGTAEIILGGYVKGTSVIYPIYKFLTADDGEFTIPAYLIRAVKFERFDSLTFSMIRRIQNNSFTDARLGDSYIVAQSIHNIKVDIPN